MCIVTFLLCAETIIYHEFMHLAIPMDHVQKIKMAIENGSSVLQKGRWWCRKMCIIHLCTCVLLLNNVFEPLTLNDTVS